MDWFWNFWNSLSQGVRDGIISTILGGVVLTAIGLAFRLSGKSIGAGLRRLLSNASNPDQSSQPPRQELIIKVEQQSLSPPQESKPQALAPDLILVPHIPRAPAVGFVARRDKDGREIVPRLKEELAPQKANLIALWGEGGVGKTTLAAETARGMIDAFGNRIVWTSADGREDFSLSTLLDEIAKQLGNPDLRRLALEPKKEDVRALIATAPTLIVLDNFETISPGEQKNCAEWIAEHAPCPALITTRTMIHAALNISIDAMSPPEAREYLELLIAQAANAHIFKGLDRDSVIKAADANPLVMQWVIAQIILAQHPRDVMDDLAHGEGDAAQRVFDRSFNLAQLGDDGRDALLALSLFVPSTSRAALADVAGFGDDLKRVNAAVKNLAALRLVETTDAGERLIIKGLTRELAKARLSKDERAEEFRHRFVTYFLGFAEAHAGTTPEDFDALEVERDNVLSAMDVAFEMEDWKSVMQVMSAIGNHADSFLRLRGYWNEVIHRGEQALYAAQSAKDEWHTGAFANGLGSVFADRGNYSLARKHYNIAVEIARKIGAEQGLAATLHELGRLAQGQGQIDEARRLYNESLEIKKKLGDQRGIALTAGQLGNIALNQGEFEEAKKLYGGLLETFKGIGDQKNIAVVLHQLGGLAQGRGEIDEARRLYNESLEIEKKLGNQSGIAVTLHQLGGLAQGRGEIDEARRLYNESLEIAEKLGNQRGIALSLGQLGRLAENEGDVTKAAQLYREALCIFEKLGSPYAEIARNDLKRVEGKK